MGTGQGDEVSWRVVDQDLHEVLAHGDDEPRNRGRRGWLVVAALAAAVAWSVVSPDDPATDPAPVDLPVAADAAVTAPSVRELAGVWLVDKGPESFAPGEMWMAFHTDGSFALDANGALLSDEPWVRGHYALEGNDLTLVVEGGGGCRAGDRFRWWVAVLPGGKLETRHRGDNHGSCRVVPGRWEARPLQDADMWRVSWRP